MALAEVHFSVASLMVLLAMGLMAEAARYPPGLDNPNQATCKNKEFTECYNQQPQVCPEFCGDQGCHVNCVTCKPVCGPDDGSSSSPPKRSTLTKEEKEKNKAEKEKEKEKKKQEKEKAREEKKKEKEKKKEEKQKEKKKNSPPVYPSPPTVPTPSPPVYPSPPTEPTPSPPTESTPSPTVYPSPPTEPTPTPTTPSTPPSSEVSAKRRSRCRNPKYGKCYNVEHVCPAACPTGCVVDCVTCKPMCNCDQPGSVCQDPRFIGGDGITFYFHGKQNRDFCLLSDSNLHINAHFIGKRNQNMKRDFTWVQAVGILFGDHQIYVSAQKTAAWDDSVDRLGLTFDGQPIYLPESEGAKWKSEVAPSVTITRSSTTNKVIVEVEGNFKITANVVPITEEESKVHSYGITKDDCFAHLDLGFKFYSLAQNVNGVLGQTYAKNYVSKVKMGASMPVMGGDDKFIVSNVLAKDCAVARFTGSSSSESSSEYTSISCSSGIDGRGVVCKK
ncbi:hypothetical protein C5167_035820 [Papaver somniferum]|uniref:uncharacterized protein LOC113336925 n=1 Tax=Papaver somniferum TaxID=3469 RepID=UPI000E6FCB5B|nr:uncharacterized protein LOC113336925 [Papaver somniferum]RZC89826.1 hypothetical protein C5167_035820 [Papaver somniferum]